MHRQYVMIIVFNITITYALSSICIASVVIKGLERGTVINCTGMSSLPVHIIHHKKLGTFP